MARRADSQLVGSKSTECSPHDRHSRQCLNYPVFTRENNASDTSEYAAALKNDGNYTAKPCKSPAKFGRQSLRTWKTPCIPTASHVPQCHTFVKGLKVTLLSLAEIPPIFKTANRDQVGFWSLIPLCSPGTIHTAGTDNVSTSSAGTTRQQGTGHSHPYMSPCLAQTNFHNGFLVWP